MRPEVGGLDSRRLDALLKARSVALIGASERSLWSNAAYSNLTRFGFPGPIHLVNRKGGVVYGRVAHASVAEIEGEIDVALVMTPEAVVERTLAELGGKARAAVVLSAGFAETGAEGRARQEALAARARESGIALLGPNCLGFVNFVDRVPLWTTLRRRQREAGAIAIVSQSGAIANNIAEFAFRQGVPLSHLVSTGNEADIDIASVMGYLASEQSVRAIAVFMESARDPNALMAAAQSLNDRGKPVVVLKVGASEISASAARAHTGSLVGDDRAFDAVCERYGMVRVHSMETLVHTADLLARLPPTQGGVGFCAISGGMCEIAADRFEAEGIGLPRLAPETKAKLRGILSDYATPNNPLDVTGAAILDVPMFSKSIAALGSDPEIGLVACLFDAPEDDKDMPLGGDVMSAISAGIAASGKPGVVFSNYANNTSALGRKVERDAGVVYSSAGLDRGVSALAAALRWRRRGQRERSAPALAGGRPASERALLAHLALHGAPIVPGVVVTSAVEAKRAATSFGGRPVALKVVSPHIEHKTDVGGVVLGVGPDSADGAYEAMMGRVRAAAPDARVEGAIISPMREAGIELIVGVTHDPQWGATLSVGFGGVLVEVLRDISLSLLPVSVEEVDGMLESLRGSALFDGFRGAPAADREAVAEAVCAIGRAALALGPDLVTLEVNPLWVRGDRVEALDALAIWKEA